jgi:flagellar biosynthesis chaperone FliJ
MCPFRFELEAVRALSERTEASSRVELAGELMAGLNRDRELTEASSVLDEARTGTAVDDGVLVGVWDILVADAYLQRREVAQAKAADEVALQERRIEVHRSLLVEASRRRHVLERLKLRRQEAYRAGIERAELAHLNEVALMLHDRRARERVG